VFGYRQFQINRVGWRGILGIAAALAVGLSLIVLSLGIAFILVPVVAVALLIWRWRFSRLKAEAARDTGPQPPRGRIIEVDYSVIENKTGR
jgi:membrane protein implicated in regulation of membrane protease activity